MRILIIFILLTSSYSFAQKETKGWFQEFLDKIDNEYGWGNSAVKKQDQKKSKEKNGWTKFWDKVDYTFDTLVEDEKRIDDSLRNRSPAKLDSKDFEKKQKIKKINKE